MKTNPIKRRIVKYEAILANKVWKKTPLLRIFSDRMQVMLSRLKAAYTSNQGSSLVPVYVLMYHQEGGLTIWEDMLKKIQHSVGRRPVFLSLDEAKMAIQNHEKEGIVCMDMPKQAVMGSGGLRYLRPEHVRLQNVKAFWWGGKLFHFNELSLIEMNSDIV